MPWPLDYEVLQGSILSLTFFNIYMKPLDEVTWRFSLGCHQHADDTQLSHFWLVPGRLENPEIVPGGNVGVDVG